MDGNINSTYHSLRSNKLDIKSERNRPSKILGIFEFLEFLKVVAYMYDSTIGPHNIYFLMAKYQKFARFQPYMVIFWSTETVALKKKKKQYKTKQNKTKQNEKKKK